MTVYLTPDVAKRLKLHAAAIDSEMSAVAERAIVDYLDRPEAEETLASAIEALKQRAS